MLEGPHGEELVNSAQSFNNHVNKQGGTPFPQWSFEVGAALVDTLTAALKETLSQKTWLSYTQAPNTQKT